MKDQPATKYDPQLFALYEQYAHGHIDRRGFLQGAAKFAVGGLTAEALLANLSPNYALAEQVAADDPRVETGYLEYESPHGGGTIRGYLVKPSNADSPLPAVLVVHENRGLNPHIEDVTRRLGIAGFLAFAPDMLTPLGGYPGTDDEGRAMQSRRDREEMTQDFMAAAKMLQSYEGANGKVGVVGFCFGGGMANTLAVRLPEVITAAVAFYGSQPAAEDVPKIQSSILLHYAEHDDRINAGRAAYEEALEAEGVDFTSHFYEGVNHAFLNDTTPRYDEQAATLAWQRTLDFFNEKLR